MLFTYIVCTHIFTCQVQLANNAVMDDVLLQVISNSDMKYSFRLLWQLQLLSYLAT